MTPALATDDPVWYVAYASNLCADRLTCYLAGGRPDGALRTYEGCRDPAAPTDTARLDLPGRLVFSGRSRVWGGASAFLDPTAPGRVVARGYQVSFGQLSDLVSQETRQQVGRDLTPPLDGVEWRTPSGVYETLVLLGHRRGWPVFTLTSLRRLEPGAPSAEYLRVILRGLAEVTDWPADRRAAYLLEARGIAPAWSAADLVSLCSNEDLTPAG